MYQLLSSSLWLFFLLGGSATFGAASTYDNRTESRIGNGQPAANGQFPYQVSLVLKRKNGFHDCGGSIISADYVLTAAQCTNGVRSGTVYYGSTLRTGGRSAYFEKFLITQHAGFNPNTRVNDISLIRVPLILDGGVRAIGLPPMDSYCSLFVGNYALISGYGETTEYGKPSNTLNWARVQIISNSDCRQLYGAIVNGGTVCVSTPSGISDCEGDIGGPLALDGANLLVGISSSGSSCTPNYASIFTRVTYFRDWIYNKSGI